ADFFLDPLNLQFLRRATEAVVRELTDRYLDPDSELEEAILSAGAIQVRRADQSEETLDADLLLWGTEFYNEARASIGPSTSETQSIVQSLLAHFFESPYSFEVNPTGVARANARQSIPVTEGDSVVVGEVFVSQGNQITPFRYRALRAHQAALQAAGRIPDQGRDWGSELGSFLLNLLLLGVFGVLIFFYRPEVYRSYRWVFLLSFLVAVYFLIGAGISSLQDEYWPFLPIAFVILPVAILWDGRMALILAVVLGLVTGAQEPFGTFQILAFTVMGGAAAALSARAVRRRSQTWIFIALITLAYTLVLTAFLLKGAIQPGDVLLFIVFAAANATASAILAMGFMPVFEWFTGITTDQTLLEWADPNRPLLKSLSLEASGTYAHTISVANLAEAAATAIGANGLLARIGIYYHDVGKMLKPQYFVENQPGGKNPHDKLKPHTSASIVREHVVEGEKMARNEGVPDVIARFIPEHHGTQLIGFFYEKAKEESEEEPDPADFRYPGPKPQSKETAIAMLADSIESATRAMQDPSPERIGELIQTIVDGKIQDGQLSEAPLTLRELGLIQEQFVKVVSGMFHHRLDYPATRHITESPDPKVETPEAEPVEGTDDPKKVPPKAEQLPLTPSDDPENGQGPNGG
ncbi:MAG: HDIG domain-containing protein, partial [Gemmatimonadetes bacterium]|nr:HDIG domain-containing protein [Gemmatimonadota bacterium]